MAINPKLVRVYRLSDSIEGRPTGAWVFQYHGESFLTDADGGNPEPFAWSDQPHEVITFDVKTREEIAGTLRINPAKLGLVQRADPTFPAPILTFRDGPIWAAEAIEAWAPTRPPDPTRICRFPKRFVWGRCCICRVRWGSTVRGRWCRAGSRPKPARH
jgi:hypothetical protein